MRAVGGPVVLINSTGVDIRPVETAVIAACKTGGILPEELADIFVLVRVPDGVNDLATATGRPCWRLTMRNDAEVAR